MKSVTAVLLIISVVTRAHAAGPPTQRSLGGSDRIGRLFDGVQTPVPSDGFLLGSFDADPAKDVLVGGNALTLWAATAEGTFVQDGTFSLTEAFTPLSVARMNDDPYPDLVGSTASGFAIVDGTASGFAMSPRHPAGAPPTWAVIGDMDGDGLDDAVYSDDQTVTVFINHGTTFEPVTSPDGPYGWGVGSVGDLDGDGDLDAIESGLGPTHYSPFIRTLRNVGAGRLTVWNDYPLSEYAADQLVTADVDDDGHLDIVAAGNQMFVLWNDGSGGFGERLDLPPFTDTGAGLAVADLDGDGMKDLVGFDTSSGGTWAHIYVGLGGRGFEPGPATFTGRDLQTLKDADVGDVDADGVLDLVTVMDGFEGFQELFLFRGRSHSMPGQRAYPVGLPGFARSWAVEFHNTSRSSVLVVSPDSALYYESRGDGTLQRPFPLPVAAGSTPVDFTGDGRDDLIGDGDEEVIIRRCLGGLSFSQPETLRVGNYKLTADFNGDGFADLLAASAGVFHVVPGLGNGSFGTPGPDLNPIHGYVHAFAAADLDGDGAAEMATTERDELGEDHLMIYRNDGASTLVPWRDSAISQPSDYPSTYPRRVSFLNFDDDGITDISVGYSETDFEVMYVARGLGGGEFAFVDTVVAGSGEDMRTTFADLDQDGFDEAIVTSYSSYWAGYLMIWANEGGRYAKEEFLVAVGGRTTDAAVGDFDGNGFPDLVVATRPSGYPNCEHVTLHLNRLMDAPVPVLASLSASKVTTEMIRTEWNLGAAQGTAYLERSETLNLWSRIASDAISQGSIAFEDRDVIPGREYSYRLAVHTAEGDYTTQPLTARIPIPALSLRPTHGSDARRVGFALTTMGPEPVEIAIHDVQGRRVGSHRYTPRTSGETVEIELAIPAPMRPGVYWATAKQGISKVAVKLVRLF